MSDDITALPTPTDNKQRARSFLFVLNNYNDADIVRLRGIVPKLGRYLVFGYESAPTTGTPHLQGYIYLKNPATFNAVLKRLGGGRVRLFVANGSASSNITYAKKDGKFEEFGEPPSDADARGKGEIQRWSAIRQACEEGRYEDLPDDFVCRHYRSFDGIRRLKLSRLRLEDLTALDNHWYHGPTGTGKSMSARLWAKQKGMSIYLKDSTKWWDGYEHEPVALIEELGPQHFIGSSSIVQLLKQWADHYCVRVELKGASMVVRPKHLIVTSNFRISELCNTVADVEALERRFQQTEISNS